MLRWFSSFLTVVACFFVVGCMQISSNPAKLNAMSSQERTMIILQKPQVNDIYVANITKFSAYMFGEGLSDTYGLLRVIEVNPSSVILLTEVAGWPIAEGALEDIQGDFSRIVWDQGEEITVQRNDLLELHKEGYILDARRLTRNQIKKYLN